MAARNILYVDDDRGLSRLVEKDLKRQGYAVTLAGDGREGVRLAAEQRFDLIALDHFMPGQDGLETLAQLKLLPDAPPVIYVTGTDEGRVAVAALKAGALDYVVKDVQGNFLTLLRSALEQAFEQIELKRQKEDADREVREARDRAERLAEAQAVLLREVNHRVANSLQLISAMVHMQLNAIADPAAREVLVQTQNRIIAVTQVHRRLYTGDDATVVEMQEYLKGLIEELKQSLRTNESRHTFQLDAEPVHVPTEKAVPIGVIVSELVTNAVKYAYPPDAPGPIRVAFKRIANGLVSLSIEDEGVGLAGSGLPKGSGLGRTVVNAMATSLSSLVELDSEHKGTRFVISFAP